MPLPHSTQRRRGPPRVTEVGTAGQPHGKPLDGLRVGGDASFRTPAGQAGPATRRPRRTATALRCLVGGPPLLSPPRTPERGGSLMYYLFYYLIVEVGVYNLLLSVMAC